MVERENEGGRFGGNAGESRGKALDCFRALPLGSTPLGGNSTIEPTKKNSLRDMYCMGHGM